MLQYQSIAILCNSIAIQYYWTTPEDKVVTLEVVHKLIERLEDEFHQSINDEVSEEVADVSVFVLASFLGNFSEKKF